VEYYHPCCSPSQSLTDLFKVFAMLVDRGPKWRGKGKSVPELKYLLLRVPILAPAFQQFQSNLYLFHGINNANSSQSISRMIYR
jgi:hypothetical protein